MPITHRMSLDLMKVTRDEILEFIDYMPESASLSTGLSIEGTGEFFDELNLPKASLEAEWTSTPGDGKI